MLHKTTVQEKKVFSWVFRRSPLFFAIPFVILIRLFSPIVLIRIGQINAGRIGHFAMDVELSLLKRKISSKSFCLPITIDLYFIYGTPSNLYLMKLWKQKINFYPKWLLHPIHRLNVRIPGFRKFDTFNGISHTDLTLLDKFEPSLKMSQHDEDASLSELKHIGIFQDDKIVCLSVRDSEYLRVTFSDTDWSEHNHRDSKITTYVEAAELLASMGYKVVRMGKIVADKFQSSNTSVIDYANSSIRSDMLDVYLFSHAKFIITTSTGMDFLGAIFRVPMGLVNVVSPVSIFKGDLLKSYQPKEIVDSESGKHISLEELIKLGYNEFYNKSDFDAINVAFIDNSTKDLCNFFSELELSYRNNAPIQYASRLIPILEKYNIRNDNWAKLSPSWLINHPYFLAGERL